MKDSIHIFLPLTATIIVVCLGLASVTRAENSSAADQHSSSTKSQQAKSVNAQRKSVETRARPEVEQQRKEAEQKANSSLDQEAIAAIDETEKAIDALASNKSDQALAAIERASGKINVLLGRNPATALIPVSAEVDVIDTAPQDTKEILQLAQDAAKAVDDKDYPTARLILHSLMSEIHVRTYTLPLATYPNALRDAARLIDQKKTDEARSVLLSALNTLVAVDKVTPLPLVVAHEAVKQAQAVKDKDKNKAQTLLETAKHELQRSKELGYASRDSEYASLDTDISNLEKQLQGSGDTNSVFAKLKDRMSALLKKESDRQRR